MMKRVQQNFLVLDGDIYTLGKQVEKHGKVHLSFANFNFNPKPCHTALNLHVSC